MATATRNRKASTRKTEGKVRAAKTTEVEDGPTAKEQRDAQTLERRERVRELREMEPATPWAEVAEDLGITSGRAQYLHMLNEVADDKSLVIKWDDDDDLTDAIIAAREEEDAYSSWGWISARAGVSEGKVKALAADGGYEVAGSQIAVSRAEKNGAAEKVDAKTTRQAGRKAATTGSSAKTTAARKRAARNAGKDTDPS
jgi:hypothetical protein